MSPIHWYFLLFASTSAWFSNAEVMIQSTESGLVFDGNNKNVKAVKPDNSTGQKWILERQKNGDVSIVNAKNKLYLDVQKGCKAGQNMNIIVYKKNSKDNQQFILHCDGTIGIACRNDIILQIKNGNVETVEKGGAQGLDVHFELVEV